MKKLSALAALAAVLVAGMVMASGSYVSRYIPANTQTIPFGGATLGIPLFNVQSQLPVTNVEVTIADMNDGGSDDNILYTCNGYAYRFIPELFQRDGGGGWFRDQGLDVACATPTGTPAFRGQVMHKAVTNARQGERLYYLTTGVADDAGTAIVHQVVIQGRY